MSPLPRRVIRGIVSGSKWAMPSSFGSLNGSFDRTLSTSGAQFCPGSGESAGRDDSCNATRRHRGGSRVGLRTGNGDVAGVLGRSDCAQSCHGRAGRAAHAALLARENLPRSGANTGCRMCRKSRSRFRRGSSRSMTTGRRFWKSRVRPASTSLRCQQVSGTSFDYGCADGSSATALIARSCLMLVRGPCGASSLDR